MTIMAISRSERRQLREALLEAFGGRPTTPFLSDLGLPVRAFPPKPFTDEEAWEHVLSKLDAGVIPDGYRILLTEALGQYPANSLFRQLLARCGPSVDNPPQAERQSSSGPGGLSARPPRPASRWDFFLSYTKDDSAWAKWIAWELEASGYKVFVQAWDCVGGRNFVGLMDDGIRTSDRLLAIMSDAYLESAYGSMEWQAMIGRDPRGDQGLVLIARVEDCDRVGLLRNIVDCDLFHKSEPAARRALLEYVEHAAQGRGKPAQPPHFPPDAAGPPPFPG